MVQKLYRVPFRDFYYYYLSFIIILIYTEAIITTDYDNNKSYGWLPIAFFNRSCKEETRAAYDLALRINLLIIFSIN